MVASSGPVDLYAVLQVHPGADQEIIEAAYRQLMKKYHPDVAGDDPERIALHHQRAKALNEAYAVLRDPAQRQRYDAWRTYGGTSSWAAAPGPSSAARSASGQTASSTTTPGARPTPQARTWRQPEESVLDAVIRAPFATLAAAYYLLPGPYEWESGGSQELLTICVLPIVGIGAFMMFTGRLTPWIGHSVNAALFAWSVLVVLSLPLWRSLPRVALAVVPSALLLSGGVQPLLRQASLPAWLAWVLLGGLSLMLSARLYVFAVLPTLAACWLISRAG